MNRQRTYDLVDSLDESRDNYRRHLDAFNTAEWWDVEMPPPITLADAAAEVVRVPAAAP